MQLSITTTHQPATDLGYLLHKHPDKVQSFPITAGKAHVFYPEVSSERCTAVLLIDINSIDLVRTLKTPGKSMMLQHYVNDRPYVASSFSSHAIAKVYGSALNGNCKDRPEAVDIPMPLEVEIAVMKVQGGPERLREIFEPLGYEIRATRHLLDQKFTQWGESNYYTVCLKNTLRLQDLLSHLYVLLPTFDNEKHYFVSKAELEKLLERGGTWLKNHPKKEWITRRYLKYISSLTKPAIQRLTEREEINEEVVLPKIVAEKRQSMHQQRLATVYDALVASQSKTVLDLGCGEGKLMKMLMKNGQFEKIVGMDVSYRSLNIAKERLYFENMTPFQQERIQLMQGSVTYRDKRMNGFDAAVLVEVIEHLELDRLPAMERVIFEFAKAKTVIITTPNAEYNDKYEFLAPETFRHDDHRFEWDRAQFKAWVEKVGAEFGYHSTISFIGEVDEKVGASSQMVIFNKI